MSGQVEQKILKAKQLYARYGQAMLDDPKIGNVVDKYRNAIINTNKSMKHLGIVEACTLCAPVTGSCCFREVEEWYDDILLLIESSTRDMSQ